jgi:hypothetical protein
MVIILPQQQHTARFILGAHMAHSGTHGDASGMKAYLHMPSMHCSYKASIVESLLLVMDVLMVPSLRSVLKMLLIRDRAVEASCCAAAHVRLD